MRLFLIISFCLQYILNFAQIVSIDPSFPDREEQLTVTYDATLGSGGLVGVSQVYMHTGLITNLSTSGSDWKNVVGDWGTDDSRVKMTSIGNDKHEISFSINSFYGVNPSTTIEKLAFVFRNVDGSKEGKTASGGDIFLDYIGNPEEFIVKFESPTEQFVFAEQNETIPIKIISTNPSTTIELYVDGDKVSEASNTSELEYSYTVSASGEHTLNYMASSNQGTAEGEVKIISNPEPTVVELPIDSKPGITRLDENTIRCVLIAPGKNFSYVIGSFNDWTPNSEYLMNITSDNNYMWLDIEGINMSEDYALQYLVDGKIYVADPFSELVVDTWNDGQISQSVFPNIPDFELPNDGYATWLSQDDNFSFQYESPTLESEDLVIYELLVRDFVENRSYKEVLDRLDYLSDLGINAIEFMPVNEFEGNDSWGYNPSFHMALDKYYGTPLAFKKLVDACHEKGILVILDVVYNHAFSQSPLTQMWWDPANFKPTTDNPFLNVEAKHPFNVGYDFNHESPWTQLYVEQTLSHWINEYKIDGFRFDLSKGFSQRDVSNDAGLMASYDASRINTLKNYADYIWSEDPNSKVILEHFADNIEEKELAEYGMMLWSNHNYQTNEATMGYIGNSNFDWIDYKNRDWVAPRAVNYMESHDEERLMFKNITYGNDNGDYSVKDQVDALQRMEAISALFYAFPGPKMLWQFGEMGYDYSINTCSDGSINDNCRLTPKPIRWDYLTNIKRKRLYDVTAALIKLKTEYGLTIDYDYMYDLSGEFKYFQFTNENFSGVIVSNFDIASQSQSVDFPQAGTYYEYLSGDTLEVENQTETIELQPGSYRVYLSKFFQDPVILSGVVDPDGLVEDYATFPSPASDLINISLTLKQAQTSSIVLYNSAGTEIISFGKELNTGANNIEIPVLALPAGMYFLELNGDTFKLTDRLIISR